MESNTTPNDSGAKLTPPALSNVEREAVLAVLPFIRTESDRAWVAGQWPVVILLDRIRRPIRERLDRSPDPAPDAAE
jgi:hypothetical protein